MSPEQARGKPVDRRADIWAFGVLLFEMLSGKPLYEGETTSDILARVIEREPQLSQLPASTPAPIRELIRRCLTKNPRQRLRDIGDARLALEEYVANPSAAQSAVGTASSLPLQRRSRWFVWLLSGVGLGALVASAGILRMRVAQPAQPMMRFSSVTNYTGIDAQPAFSPDGRSVTFLSNRGGQLDIWVGLVTGGNPVRITNDPNLKARPRWSPDGSKIAYGRLNESGLWDVWTVPALGGTPRKLLSNARDASWSPDGGSLAYANSSTGTIWSCDAMGSDAHELTQPEPKVVHIQPAFSRDGRKVVFVRKGVGPYSELVWSEVSSRRVEHITDDKALALSPVWSGDNQSIYFASTRGGTMNLWKIAAHGGIPEQITAGRGDDSELDLSGDGRKIVFASLRLSINLLEVMVDSTAETGRKWLTTDASRGTLAPAYSPDGQRIAYFTNRKGAEHESVWIMGEDGSNPVKMVEDSYLNVFPRWSADGQFLVFTARHPGIESSRILRRLSLSGTVPEELPVQVSESSWGDTGPDGRMIFRATDGQVRVFDPRDKSTKTLNNVRGGLSTWSRDGQRIASIVSAREVGDTEAGVWTYDLSGGAPRQVFRGWAAAYAWAGNDELFVLEGKPDLGAVLWRVRVDGSSPVPTRTSLQLRYSLPEIGSDAITGYARFAVHPDRKRIVIETFRFQESDITMIENIR